MPITPEQRQHLFELTVSTGRPTDETPALVKQGLVFVGTGRFGTYAKATDKGRALIQALPWEARNEHDVQRHNALTQPALDAHQQHLAKRRSGRAVPREPVVLASQTAPFSCGVDAPRLQRKASKQAGKAPATANLSPDNTPPSGPLQAEATITAHRSRLIPKAPVTPSKSAAARRETSKVRGATRAPTLSTPSSQRTRTLPQRPVVAAVKAPNAVRVVLGTIVTYYPLSSYGALKHGEICRVATSNKLYRTYAMEASATDIVVPG